MKCNCPFLQLSSSGSISDIRVPPPGLCRVSSSFPGPAVFDFKGSERLPVVLKTSADGFSNAYLTT